MPGCKAWTQKRDSRKGPPHPQPLLPLPGFPNFHHATPICLHSFQSPLLLAFSPTLWLCRCCSAWNTLLLAWLSLPHCCSFWLSYHPLRKRSHQGFYPAGKDLCDVPPQGLSQHPAQNRCSANESSSYLPLVSVPGWGRPSSMLGTPF